MCDDAIVPLRCQPEVLSALGTGLRRYGPIDSGPEWLISGVWLCTSEEDFIATPTTEVLTDGHVARPMRIDSIPGLLAQIESDLPDIDGRLFAHGSGIALSGELAEPRPPESLARLEEEQSVAVLIRKVERAKTTHRVACGLLFVAGGKTVLVATDPWALAMVFSESPALIAVYRKRCDEMSVDDYLKQVGG